MTAALGLRYSGIQLPPNQNPHPGPLPALQGAPHGSADAVPTPTPTKPASPIPAASVDAYIALVKVTNQLQSRMWAVVRLTEHDVMETSWVGTVLRVIVSCATGNAMKTVCAQRG